MKLRKLLSGAASFWQLVLGIFMALSGVAWVAFGATYNFHFNNTEQGDNGTATPTVNVAVDGKVTGAEKSMLGPNPGPEAVPAAEQAAAQAPAPAPAPAAAAATSVAAIEPEVARVPREFRRVRFLVGPAVVGTKETVSRGSYNDGFGNSYTGSSYRSHQAHGGAKVELGLFASHDVAFNFFTGGFYGASDKLKGFGGAELEIQPIHISIGRFTDLVNFSFMLGATTLGRVDDNPVAAHGGARLEFGIGDQWGVAATGRANLGFYMADAALVIRL